VSEGVRRSVAVLRNGAVDGRGVAAERLHDEQVVQLVVRLCVWGGFVRCLRGVWEGGCLAGVWEVSGRCLGGV